MKILFMNGSPNKNGNTAALAEALMEGKEYETLNLTDYRIGSYGQAFEDDQLDEVIAKMKPHVTCWTGFTGRWKTASFRGGNYISCSRGQLRKNG